MNNLSWLIYAADVLPKLAATMTFISLVLCVVLMFISMFTLHEYEYKSEKEQRAAKRRLRFCFVTALVCLFVIIAAQFIPSTDTIYLIAGSEIGEVAVVSERGQELLNKVNSVLDAQLERLTR